MHLYNFESGKYNKKIENVNSRGSLLFPQKNSETPMFIAFRATKLKTGVRFHLLEAGFFKENNFEKRVALEDSACFHPKTPIMRKPEKYIDPSRLAMSKRLSVMVPLKRQPKNPPTHKRADKTLSRRNNIRTEQSRKDNPKMTTRIDKKQTRTHNKTPRKQKHKKKGRARTKKTTNPKNASTRDKLDRKKVVCQTPNTTTNMKQQRIP